MKRLWVFALALLLFAAGCAGAEVEPVTDGPQSGAVVTVFHSPT